MSIKCLIVDDEPLAIQLIENHVAMIDRLEVVGTCQSALQAFDFLKENEVELMFLDIKMPGLTGLDFLKTIKNPPKTILTTAYREFALDGYELQVVDYLLKPITFERFFKAVDRFLNEQFTAVRTETKSDSEQFIMVRSGTKHHRIPTTDILFIESTKDYITLHLQNSRPITSKYRISAIEEDLKDGSFLRVHRSYIINTIHLKAFTIHDIDVAGREIPIGASYRESVQTFLDALKENPNSN